MSTRRPLFFQGKLCTFKKNLVPARTRCTCAKNLAISRRPLHLHEAPCNCKKNLAHPRRTLNIPKNACHEVAPSAVHGRQLRRRKSIMRNSHSSMKSMRIPQRRRNHCGFPRPDIMYLLMESRDHVNVAFDCVSQRTPPSHCVHRRQHI